MSCKNCTQVCRCNKYHVRVKYDHALIYKTASGLCLKSVVCCKFMDARTRTHRAIQDEANSSACL